MRIAVDARPFEECPTGVGRYLDGLLSAWLRARPEDSFVLLSPRPGHVPARLEGRVAVRPTPALFSTIWLQTAAGPAAVCSQIVPKSAGVGGTATRPSRRGGTWTGRGDRRTKLSSGRARSQAESSPSR